MSLFDKFSAAKHKDAQDSQSELSSVRAKVEAEFAELAFYTLDLKRGLERDEFQLFYLPKMDLATGDIIAVKAVLRWQHPHRGLLPPQSFIPYAEKAGMMPALGNWMMEHVLQDINEIRSIGLSPLPVTIALTEKQCQSPNLVSKVTGLLSGDCLNPDDLSFDVPQNMEQSNDGATASNLRVLRWLGVQCNASQSSILDEIESHIYPTPNHAEPQVESAPKVQGYYYGSPMSFEQVCENLFDKTALAV